MCKAAPFVFSGFDAALPFRYPSRSLRPMFENYLPVLLQIVIAGGFAVVTLIASALLGKSARRTPIKDSAYECGMLPVGDSQPRFSVKFYIVAMLFVLFDIEVVFLYPWAVIYKDFLAAHGASILAVATGFVSILLVAFVYAWKKGALDWKS
jgi:NADH-quinone oxidoreductase subunit A